MSDEKNIQKVEPEVPSAQTEESNLGRFVVQNIINPIWSFFKEIIRLLFTLFMLIPRTITVLMPSVAYTTDEDKRYNRDLIETLKQSLKEIDQDRAVSEDFFEIIQKHWLEQIKWVNQRANRERDANEIIRWWQIIFSIIIPTLAVGSATYELNRILVSVFGVLVAIMTAVYQFRRPEERWRHYRVLTERYLIELWDFISLSGDAYKKEDGSRHKKHTWETFIIFNDRMTKLHREDIDKFFSDVVSSNKVDMDKLTKRIEELVEENRKLNTKNGLG